MAYGPWSIAETFLGLIRFLFSAVSSPAKSSIASTTKESTTILKLIVKEIFLIYLMAPKSQTVTALA